MPQNNVFKETLLRFDTLFETLGSRRNAAGTLPQEDVDRIAEALAARLTPRLDALLAAVRNHGELLRRSSENDGGTLFFS